MNAAEENRGSKTKTPRDKNPRGLPARPRPGAGACNEGNDGDAGGDIDDAAWDANEETSHASRKSRPPSDKQKQGTKNNARKVPPKDDPAASADAPKKKKKKNKKKRDRSFDTNPLKEMRGQTC